MGDTGDKRAKHATHATPTHPWDRPCAAPGLQSYRARGRYGWIMIGAHDDAEAWREARRSTPAPHGLERWDGERYVLCARQEGGGE